MRLVTAAVVGLLLAACGPAQDPGSPPDAAPAAPPPASSGPAPTSSPGDASTSSAGTVAPTPRPAPGAGRAATAADAAAYLASARPEGVARLLGIAVDLDADDQREVVLHGVRDGRGWLGVATWDGTAYGLVAEVEAGPARRTEDLHVADVNDDGDPELVLATSGDGTASLALWAARRADRLVPLDAVGGCADGSNVYGVLGAELVATGDGPLDVLATCDDSPLPVADWSEQRWVWSDGAYRHRPEPAPTSPVPAPPSPSPTGPLDVDTDT